MAIRRALKKRPDGDGTIYSREVTRENGSTYLRWEAKVSLGYEGGKRKRKVVYGKTQKEAKEKLDQIKRQIADGTYSDSKQTLKSYLEQYLEYKTRQVKAITVDSYERLARLHINPQLGKILLPKLKAQDIRSMMYNIADKTGARTANACRTLLYSLLEQAVKDELLVRNVCAIVDKLKHETKTVSLWTPEQTSHFLEVAKSHKLYAAFYLALATGMRRGELLAMRWSNIDIVKGVLSVESSLNWLKGEATFSKPKTAHSQRRVSISSDVIDVLEKHRQLQGTGIGITSPTRVDLGLVFTNLEGGAMHPKTLTNAWWSLQDKAKVPRIRFHDLRHLHVSLLIKQGFDVRTVADRVGHRDPSFTLRTYTHAFEEQRKQAAISLGDLLKN